MTAPFNDRLKAAQDLARLKIDAHLTRDDMHIPDAMRHAVAGGKGMRAFFVIESAAIYDIPVDVAVHCAAGIEALHAYSLVHDDLPCIDNDDLRRGQPTIHKKWNEATAVLTGDALHSLAFELVLSSPLAGDIRADLGLSLAKAAGINGMIGGEALDVLAETAQVALSLDQIITLQAQKTGALIAWSCTAGARMAGAHIAPFETYGHAVGLAFQIADDILDVQGDMATAGKALRKDDRSGKATFVSCLGLDEAKRQAAELIDQACDALDFLGAKADYLKDAARFVLTRNR